MIRCRKCKSSMPDGARFCMNCGNPLNAETTNKRQKHYRPRGTGSVRTDRRNGQSQYIAYLPKKLGGGYIGSYKTYEDASNALMREISSLPTSDRANWSVKQFYNAFLLSDAFTTQSRDGQNSMKAAW